MKKTNVSRNICAAVAAATCAIVVGGQSSPVQAAPRQELAPVRAEPNASFAENNPSTGGWCFWCCLSCAYGAGCCDGCYGLCIPTQ